MVFLAYVEGDRLPLNFAVMPTAIRPLELSVSSRD